MTFLRFLTYRALKSVMRQDLGLKSYWLKFIYLLSSSETSIFNLILTKMKPVVCMPLSFQYYWKGYLLYQTAKKIQIQMCLKHSVLQVTFKMVIVNSYIWQSSWTFVFPIISYFRVIQFILSILLKQLKQIYDKLMCYR